MKRPPWQTRGVGNQVSYVSDVLSGISHVAKVITSPASKRNLGKRNTNKRNGRKGKGSSGNLSESGQTVSVVPRSLGWAPRRMRVTLRYNRFSVLNNAAIQYANIRLQPTYCYDVDPVLGSTAMPGFVEYGGIYRFYRLRSSRIRVTFSNLESFPVQVYLVPVNYDPTANANPFVFMTSSMLCKKVVLGPSTGNGVGKLTHGMSTAAFTGIRDVQVADSYSAPTSGASSPANNWFWAIGGNGTSVFASGVAISIDMECEVDFFELTNPTG